MRNQYSPDSRIVINCVNCRNKLRVPLDKGKISVTCPVCRREFRYNPNSIIDTLRQIVLSIVSLVSKSRRNLLIFIAAALILVAVLFFMLFGSDRQNMDKSNEQGIEAYNSIQTLYNMPAPHSQL
ncbi:MAG: hypothetical protein N3I35_01955 [Clostridia bacterium]|nr:hypothetical protein [Clostridia bacterium]